MGERYVSCGDSRYGFRDRQVNETRSKREIETLHVRSGASPPTAEVFPASISPQSQSGYASSSIARTVGLAFKYATPNKGAPPGIEPTSCVGLGRPLPGGAGEGFAVDVEGSTGVDSGCEIPVVEDDRAAGVAVEFVLEGGGCDRGASWVVVTVATERESEDGDERRVDGRRNRRLRRQEVQSMVSTVEER